MSNPELDPLVEGGQAQEPTVALEMTVNDLNVVFASLQELPHRVADPILKKLFQQAQAQLGQPQAQ